MSNYLNISGDDVEQRAIASLFSSSGNHPFVSSSKGSFGHMLGAAGAVEAVSPTLFAAVVFSGVKSHSLKTSTAFIA